MLSRLLLYAMLERLAVQELHGDEVPAFVLVDVVDGADVGMVEGRCRLRLALESLERVPVPGHLFREELQRDGALEPGVFRLVDDTHPPAAELFQNPVVRNGLADHGEGPPGPPVIPTDRNALPELGPL